MSELRFTVRGDTFDELAKAAADVIEAFGPLPPYTVEYAIDGQEIDVRTHGGGSVATYRTTWAADVVVTFGDLVQVTT